MRQRPERRESTPDSYIGSGVIAGIGTAVLAAGIGLDRPAGVVVAIAGGVFAQTLLAIGVVAKGVQLGNRSPRD